MIDNLTVVQPVQITDAMVTATNVPENDHPEWSSATTYALTDRVIRNHSIWESLQAANTNHTPESSSEWWVRVSATNRWRAFDEAVNTQTVAAPGEDSIEYTLTPSLPISAVALMNISDAFELTVEIVDSSVTVFSETVYFRSLPSSPTWWHWLHDRTEAALSQYLALDIPTVSASAQFQVTLIGESTLGVGIIILGQQRSIGLSTQAGARVGITDYSRQETNDFGDTIFMRRAFAKRMSFSLFLDNSEVDTLQAFLADVRAVPCLWVASRRFEALTVYGAYSNFEIHIAYAQHSECEFEIKGLI